MLILYIVGSIFIGLWVLAFILESFNKPRQIHVRYPSHPRDY